MFTDAGWALHSISRMQWNLEKSNDSVKKKSSQSIKKLGIRKDFLRKSFGKTLFQVPIRLLLAFGGGGIPCALWGAFPQAATLPLRRGGSVLGPSACQPRQSSLENGHFPVFGAEGGAIHPPQGNPGIGSLSVTPPWGEFPWGQTYPPTVFEPPPTQNTPK